MREKLNLRSFHLLQVRKKVRRLCIKTHKTATPRLSKQFTERPQNRQQLGRRQLSQNFIHTEKNKVQVGLKPQTLECKGRRVIFRPRGTEPGFLFRFNKK